MSLVAATSSRFMRATFGALVAFICFTVMLGWHLDWPVLTTLVPGYAVMKVNTAVALFCFAMVLMVLNSSWKKRLISVAWFFLILGFSIAVVTLIQYVFGANFGIDEILYVDREGVGKNYPPGRLAPVTAVSFALLGLAVFLVFFKRRPLYKLGQVLLVVTALISFQALVASALGMQTSFGISAHTRMALHTAISFVLLSVGFLSMTVTRGYMPVLVSSTEAGETARKLVAMAIFSPPFFSFLEYAGKKYDLFDPDLGTLLRVVGSVVFFVIIIWRSTDRLHLSLRAHRRQQNKLVQSERDLLKHIQQEHEAVAAQKEAQRAGKMKSDFLASVSHEIRTPLNGIMGMLTLLGNTELNRLQKSFIQTMDTSSQVLLNLINQILDLSKIESGKINLLENNFDLKALVEGAIAIVDLPARQKQLIIAPQIHVNAVGFYLGDSFRVQQILLNLLNNAIKFSSNGIITVKIEKVNEVKDESTLRFEVIDSGVGVDEDSAGKLFQMYGGTGLGLAVAKQLVDLMQGRIGVESKPGSGAKFFFEIRLKNSNVVAMSAIGEPGSSNQLKEKIQAHLLVAEDNKVNQRVISSMVEILGATVKVVENGMDAIEALRSEYFDIILMDGQMPEMDGYEATRRIRLGEAGAQNQKIPILAVTANVVQGNAQECYDAGMNDFISKPIDFDDLTYKIKRWVTRGRNVIDKKAIEVLQQLANGGNKNLIKDLVNLFKQETAPVLKTLRSQVQENDFAAAAKTAHHLKSSCANLGAYKMQEITEKIEKLKNTGTQEQLLDLVDALEQEFQLASSELQKYMAS